MNKQVSLIKRIIDIDTTAMDKDDAEALLLQKHTVVTRFLHDNGFTGRRIMTGDKPGRIRLYVKLDTELDAKVFQRLVDCF